MAHTSLYTLGALDDYLEPWRELPHALNILFTCAMQLLAIGFLFAVAGAVVYFVAYQLSRLVT